MKTALHIVNIAILCILAEAFLLAEDTSADLPDGSWEQHPEGVAFTMTFITQEKGGSQNSSLKIYLKNTSDTPKEVPGDVFVMGVRVLNNDKSGSWEPLRTIDPHSLIRGTTMAIQPGQTIIYPIDLSPDEANVIRSHSVQFHLGMFDSAKKQAFTIDSSPRQVTETVIAAP